MISKIAEKEGNTFLQLIDINDEEICIIKWNPKIMDLHIDLGYERKEYKYNRTITNLHSGDKFIVFKEFQNNERCKNYP